jgi:DNA polymerase-3 subunit gamma/tau
MAYQVLARKWRPQNFSSLIGQEPIVTALRNGLAEGRIAHAYLFSGIRGVGKTTAARVLAKALNCERGPAPDPCNECASCLEIGRGSDLDVLEVDAATYSKVEQVRELTESLRYGPARDRYKVVVLDEIHRLSRQAFDALLKIVEEPPPYLVFIFATTEIEAVPATILSRCQEFQFRRVTAPAVAALLRQICDSESIHASDSALRLVARAGEGSVRDAVALLDQLATFGSGTIADDAAVRLLGGLDIALFRRLLQAILEGDAATVSREARFVEDEGWDSRHVYGQFLAYCRDALHLALGSDPSHVDLPGEEALALAELARGGGYENLLRLLNQLLSSETLVRRTETGALAVEIAWLRAAELPKLVRIEELLGGGAATAAERLPLKAAPARPVTTGAARPSGPSLQAAAEGPGPVGAPVAGAGVMGTGIAAAGVMGAGGAGSSTHPGARPAADRSRDAGGNGDAGHRADVSGRAVAASDHPGNDEAASRTAAPAAPAPPAPPPALNAGSGQASKAEIQAFLDEVSARKQPLAAHLEEAADLRFEAGCLSILLPPGDVYLSSRLRQPANREAVSSAVAKVWGAAASWEVSEGAQPPSLAAVRSDTEPENAALLNPAVQTLLDIFGGKVEAVEEHRGARED